MTTQLFRTLRASGNVGLGGAAHDRALLSTGDDASFLQIIGEMTDTTYVLPMVADTLRTFTDQVGDRAPIDPKGILDPAVATVDDHGGAEIGSRASIVIVGDAITIGIRLRRIR
jgi:hypothetical protein